MKTFILKCAMLLLSSIGLLAQSGLTIKYGGAVTVNGNLTITTPPAFTCGNPLTDTRDGKTYNTVLIGTQCWFAQNLNIGNKVLGSANQTNNSIIEKYCYNDDENNCDTYGGLYQWGESMQYLTIEGAKGICPTGWHLPTETEWSTLYIFLGGSAVAGGKMKEAGTAHWPSPNAGATNSSGFTALPGGERNVDGIFRDFTEAYIWSSSQYDATLAKFMVLYYSNEYLGVGIYNKSGGFSVRCLKD